MEAITRIRIKDNGVTLDCMMIWDGRAYINIHEEGTREELGILVTKKTNFIIEYALKEGIIWHDMRAFDNETPAIWTRLIDKDFIFMWNKQ